MNTLGTLSLSLAGALGLSLNAAVQSPTVVLRSRQLTATISLPDAGKGYYVGTRFDWSGLISSLKYNEH